MKPQTPRNEFKRLVYATRNSLKGYARIFRDEAAFRFQLIILVVLIPLAGLLADSAFRFMLLVGAWVLVLAAELGNSAVEAAVDRIGEEQHDLSAKAKDAGSAMVMTLMMLAGAVWLAALIDRFGA